MACSLSLSQRIRRSFDTSAALRRHDYLHVLQLHGGHPPAANSVSLYAWYKLGCYQKVVDLAQAYRPKRARDLVAVSVSLAVTGQFQRCETLVRQNLAKLQRHKRYALEAARGIVRFMPDLALRICQSIPAATGLRSAAHLALGQTDIARVTFSKNTHPGRSDILAGHYFLKANLAETATAKRDAVNRQLSEFNLSALHLREGATHFGLEALQNQRTNATQSGPVVSVIVPAFNAEAHLQISVLSLLAQSYTALDIIIVDDGSSDGTGRVAQELVARDTRVRVLTLPHNRGAYAARNEGLRAAKGLFVTVQDADDFAHPQKIERQVAPLLKDQSKVFSIADLVRVTDKGLLARRDIYPLQRMNTSSLTFRRDPVLRECGVWEEKRYGADGEFVFRLRSHFATNQLARLREPLTFAADHASSLTARVSTGGKGVASDPGRIAYTEDYTQKWLASALCPTGT